MSIPQPEERISCCGKGFLVNCSGVGQLIDKSLMLFSGCGKKMLCLNQLVPLAHRPAAAADETDLEQRRSKESLCFH